MHIIIAELSTDLLEKIYELTYKYGWLTAEERMHSWLPDRAYMEKYKIEGTLSPMLTYALEEMIDAYDRWLSDHTRDGWINTMHDYVIDYDLANALTEGIVPAWGMRNVISNAIYDALESALGGVEQLLSEDPDFLIESYGISFIEHLFDTLSVTESEELREKYNKLIDEEAYTEEDAAREIIENDTYGDIDDLID